MADSKDRSQSSRTNEGERAVAEERTVVTSSTRGGPTVTEVHAVLREKAEPYSQRTGFPIIVLGLCAAIALVAVVYGVALSKGPSLADFSKERLAFLPELTPEQLARKQAMKAPNLYKSNCASCHKEGGVGEAGNYPPLINSEYVTGSAQRLIAIVHNGVKGPITVDGAVYAAQQMPANGGNRALGDEDLALLLTYVRSAWGNDASAISPEQVKFARTALEGRSEQWTEAQLKAFTDSPDFPAPPAPAAEEEPAAATSPDDGA